ncbi:phospholipase D family protein [Caulobacter sp. 73W]|uniref:Phospholipase D family protein n=1 Tax=Caulobacter sp. 73W TaxID=3161137 RepID=A0AB39KR55_9CAUL
MGTQGRIVFQELHHTRSFKGQFVAALTEPISSVTICSPFFDHLPAPFKDVIGFCNFMQKRGAQKIQIITRPPGSDRQAMTLEVAKILAAQGVEIFIRANPYLHAKMYHFEYERGHFRSFVGSANFTLGGFERNQELVAEMQGVGDDTACHRELDRMRSMNGAMPFNTWLANGTPTGDEGHV